MLSTTTEGRHCHVDILFMKDSVNLSTQKTKNQLPGNCTDEFSEEVSGMFRNSVYIRLQKEETHRQRKLDSGSYPGYDGTRRGREEVSEGLRPCED